MDDDRLPVILGVPINGTEAEYQMFRLPWWAYSELSQKTIRWEQYKEGETWHGPMQNSDQ